MRKQLKRHLYTDAARKEFVRNTKAQSASFPQGEGTEQRTTVLTSIISSLHHEANEAGIIAGRFDTLAKVGAALTVVAELTGHRRAAVAIGAISGGLLVGEFVALSVEGQSHLAAKQLDPHFNASPNVAS